MAAKKGKEYWTLHGAGDWVLLVIGAAGFASLLPGIYLGPVFGYAWPILVTAIAVKGIMQGHENRKY